jgi:hypothetical protein
MRRRCPHPGPTRQCRGPSWTTCTTPRGRLQGGGVGWVGVHKSVNHGAAESIKHSQGGRNSHRGSASGAATSPALLPLCLVARLVADTVTTSGTLAGDRCVWGGGGGR